MTLTAGNAQGNTTCACSDYIIVTVTPPATQTVAETWRSAAGAFNGPQSVSVNPTDSSCWVTDAQYNSASQSYGNGFVIHLSAQEAQLWKSASGVYLLLHLRELQG